MDWRAFYPAKWFPQGVIGLILIVLLFNTHVMAADRQVTANPSVLPGNEWLKNQPLKHFTLQLLATRNSTGLKTFAEKQGFAGPLVHFVVDHQGKEMHLLAQGSYATRAEAQRAAKALPAGVRPWIRTLASIQPLLMSKAAPIVQHTRIPAIDEGGVKAMPWLWSQDPQAFTIQLASAESREAIENAMQQLALPGERMVVRTQDEKGVWYALIYGRFDDEASARDTIERLPEQLRQAGPWPRRFASLHDEVSRAGP